MISLDAALICVQRAGRVILDRVSVHAGSGEFIAIIGANGAGKSTLLSILAGLLEPDSGVITLDGASLQAFAGRDLARRRAYLPQHPRCEWPLSVERLVALGLTPTLPTFGGLPGAFAPLINEALRTCDLLQHRRQAATTLSGGELARAMLARALVGNPQILIVDEPIAGLDPKHALETVRRLRTLAQSGTLVIAAIHDLTLAVRYASRVIALAEGHVQGDGPAHATLTPELIRRTFDVDARIEGTAGDTYIDFIDAAP